MNNTRITGNLFIVLLCAFFLCATHTYVSYATTGEVGFSFEDKMIEAESTVRELTLLEKQEMLGNNECVDVNNSVVLTRNMDLENGEKAVEILGKVAIDADLSKGLPSGSTNIPQKSRAYMTIKAVIGYLDRSFSGITHSKGLFYGGKIVSQSNSVVVKSLSGKYHENGGYMTSGGNQGMTTDYKETKAFKVDNRYKWQYKNVNRDKYYSTVMPYTALETKFTVKGTVNSKAFTFSLDAIRIRNGA